MTNSSRPTRSRWMAVLATFIVVGVASGAHAAGRVFNDDFESGNTSKWHSVQSGNNCKAVTTAVDGVAMHGGKYSAECNWNGTVSWQDPLTFSSLELLSWPYDREFLIRFWTRYASDVDHKMGAKALRLYPGNDSFYMGAQMEQTGGPLFLYFESIDGKSGPESYGDGTLFGDGKWHRVDIYIKQNTPGVADGVVRVFRDGVKQLEGVNIISVTPGGHWYPLEIMSNWSSNVGWEHDANNHVYWDDFEIFSDKGTGATGLMSDASITASGTTTAPSPPTNVQVQ